MGQFEDFGKRTRIFETETTRNSTSSKIHHTYKPFIQIHHILFFIQDLLSRQNQQTMGLQMDPFLSGITDHTRQESGDSGLSFSVTPDFLPNIDDSMDCLSGIIYNLISILSISEYIFQIFTNRKQKVAI